MARAPQDTLSDLARRIARVPGLCLEQVVSSADAGLDEEGTDAALVDQWGRAHPLLRTTTIGRELERATLAIFQSSVSRLHVELRQADDERWVVTDLGSTNGTFVDGRRVEGPVPLDDRQLLSVGDVGLVLVADRSMVRARPVSESMVATSASVAASSASLRLITGPGGAGLIAIGDKSVQLGSTQLALLRFLAERAIAERTHAEAVRGFVRTVELLTTLPWDTAHPEDNHVKQIVRRVRRALETLGLPDALESRHGFGYRLLVEPQLG